MPRLSILKANMNLPGNYPLVDDTSVKLIMQNAPKFTCADKSRVDVVTNIEAIKNRKASDNSILDSKIIHYGLLSAI